jgi:hypothetical protein
MLKSLLSRALLAVTNVTPEMQKSCGFTQAASAHSGDLLSPPIVTAGVTTYKLQELPLKAAPVQV